MTSYMVAIGAAMAGCAWAASAVTRWSSPCLSSSPRRCGPGAPSPTAFEGFLSLELSRAFEMRWHPGIGAALSLATSPSSARPWLPMLGFVGNRRRPMPRVLVRSLSLATTSSFRAVDDRFCEHASGQQYPLRYPGPASSSASSSGLLPASCPSATSMLSASASPTTPGEVTRHVQPSLMTDVIWIYLEILKILSHHAPRSRRCFTDL